MRPSFDIPQLWGAMNTTREAKGFTEKEMMDEINLVNHNTVPIALATVKNMVKRNDTTCQHSLHMLRWLGKTPESFALDNPQPGNLSYPSTGLLYWHIHKIGDAVAEAKEKQGLTWKQVAEALDCAPGQASGLRKLRYGISVHLAINIIRWLDRPSTDFIVNF